MMAVRNDARRNAAPRRLWGFTYAKESPPGTTDHVTFEFIDTLCTHQVWTQREAAVKAAEEHWNSLDEGTNHGTKLVWIQYRYEENTLFAEPDDVTSYMVFPVTVMEDVVTT